MLLKRWVFTTRGDEMSDLRTAAQQVVDERDAGFRGWPLEKAIDALKAALAEPQADPVAWVHPTQGHMQRRTETMSPEVVASYERGGWTPLYTHHAPKRQPQKPVVNQQMTTEPVAWMHPDDGRVIPAATMRTAVQDGGASLSSVRGYTIPLGPLRQPLTDDQTEAAYRRHEETNRLDASAWSFEAGVRWAERAHGIGGQDEVQD